MKRLSWVLLLALLGCDSKSDSIDASSALDASTTDASNTDTATSDAAQDGATDAEWTTLIEGDWTLARGSEGYQCIAVTLTDEVYIHAIRPVAPLGTHHTVLGTVPAIANVPNGQFPCDGFSVGPHMIYGSGVGTEALTFPDGVALHLAAGQQILLNLHLFNFDSESGLSGHSAIEIQTMDAADVENEAEIVLAGVDENLLVPARTTSTATGQCTFRREQTIFALFPHMHTTGVHMRVAATRAGADEIVLMDDDYDFDRQIYSTLDPFVVMNRDDRLSIACSYDNPGDAKTFGESTNDEMCYAGVYRYPASNAQPTCTN